MNFGDGLGLSPHERGNHLYRDHDGSRFGPIPARAGQPMFRCPTAHLVGAYPRTSGATEPKDGKKYAIEGLSPHERGNPEHGASGPCKVGPIPARAGQPEQTSSACRGHRAYPRTSGATTLTMAFARDCRGLSPHERGNRAFQSRIQGWRGPIPARAGQPISRRSGRPRRRAYPRTSGATDQRVVVVRTDQGLSPHERGNPNALDQVTLLHGPIPARAGQPLIELKKAEDRRAYPRTSGATRGTR